MQISTHIGSYKGSSSDLLIEEMYNSFIKNQAEKQSRETMECSVSPDLDVSATSLPN